MSQPPRPRRRPVASTALASLASLASLLGLAALAALAGCDTNARGAHFAEQIREAVSKKGNDVRKVSCPERIKIENRDTVFPCEIEMASGERGTLKVTLNVEGELSWTVE